MPDESLIERIWFGRSATDAVLRAALAPAEAAYRLGAGGRALLYDRGILRVRTPGVPVLSVGNLSIGGTGKTPVAAWLAARLLAAGAHPAIVMRGYGGDEPLVHRRLNPEVPVLTSPDRVVGARRAAAEGADCVVLDDAFQHRRIARTVDLVLVSADRWASGRFRMLPAGPWREPLGALRRSSLVLVTRKGVGPSRARSVAAELADHVSVPIAVVALELGDLRGKGEADRLPISSLDGRRLLAIAAVGDPGSFTRQLTQAGATVRMASFGDHHRFSASEVRALASGLAPDELPVCTLKDYVKLAEMWPRAASALWYVSQRVAPESGQSAIDEALEMVLRARKH